jgi:NAD+ kinase
VADSFEVRDIISVEVCEDRNVAIDILFDPEHSLEDRIMDEQFAS